MGVEGKRCADHPRRPQGSASSPDHRSAPQSHLSRTAGLWSAVLPMRPSWWQKRGPAVESGPRVEDRSLAGGTYSLGPASFRLRGGAREGASGEVPAAGRALGGREENAGPRHLQRDGSQPLQLVRRQHRREVPRQERPADDGAPGPQGTRCASRFWAPLSSLFQFARQTVRVVSLSRLGLALLISSAGQAG